MAYRFEGKQKIFSFGVYPAVSLYDARQPCDEAEKPLAPNAKKQAKDKFVRAKTGRISIDLVTEEHDKRIIENYLFDEILGRHVSLAEYEKQAKFNQDDYKPTPDEIRRFPSRVNSIKSVSNYDNGTSPSLPPELMKGVKFLKLKPSGSNITKIK